MSTKNAEPKNKGGRPRKYAGSRPVAYRFPAALVEAIEREKGDLSANELVVQKLCRVFRVKRKDYT